MKVNTHLFTGTQVRKYGARKGTFQTYKRKTFTWA